MQTDGRTDATTSAAHDAEQAVAPPPGHARFPLYDSLRAIAALSVLVFHVGDTTSGRGVDSWWEPVTGQLAIGVTIFFLISGFLLYRPFVAGRFGDGPPPRWRDFARRRVLRIVPAYWVALIVLFPFGLSWFPGGVWPDGLVIFGFLHAYTNDLFTAGLGVSWSLCVEASFYVVLPFYAALMARLLRGRSRDVSARLELGALVALGVASLAFSTVAHSQGAFALAETLPGNFHWFALGMALAVMSAAGWGRESVSGRLLAANPVAAWALAAGIFVVTCTAAGLPGATADWPPPYTSSQLALEKVLFGVVAFLLLLPATFPPARERLPQRILAARGLMWVGLVSYGLYLYHGAVIGLATDHAGGLLAGDADVAFLRLLAVALAGSIAVAAASYYAVERPVLRFKDGPMPRLRRRARVIRPAPAAAAAPTRLAFDVAGGVTAPGMARTRVTHAFAARLPADELEALRLLVDEVVSNSVTHGAVDERGRISLVVDVDAARVRVDVWDTGRQGDPCLQTPDVTQGGFGLFLVNTLASAWGAAHEPALRVWFELRRTGAAVSSMA